MNLNKRFLATGIICASFSASLFSSPIKAEDNKWYLTIGGGLAAIQDNEWDWSSYSGELKHDSGFSAELGAGYD